MDGYLATMKAQLTTALNRAKYAAVGAAVGGLVGRQAASTGGAVGGLVGATLAEVRSGQTDLFATITETLPVDAP